MLRVGEQPLGRPRLAHHAVLHHIDIVGKLPHHGQVMGDQDHRHPGLFLQRLDQVQDFSLYGHVQRRCRFIGDQHVGVVRQRHRDHDPLPLPARQLVRVLADAAFRVRYLHLGQQFDRPLPRLCLGHFLVDAKLFDQLLPHGVNRVQRRHRFLKDHRQPVAAQLSHVTIGQTGHVLAVIQDLGPVRHRGAFGQQAHDRPRRHRLARPAFPHQRNRLTLVQAERHVADRLDLAAQNLERDADVAGVDDKLTRFVGHCLHLNRGPRHRAGRHPGR